MNLTLARDLLKERGYQLSIREIQQSAGRTICRLYAMHEGEEYFLCSFRDIVKMGVKNFQYKIARLPEREQAS